MLIVYKVLLLSFSFFTNIDFDSQDLDWGFFSHKKINRMAVFILPPELIGFYKKHIEYITEHAIDPDKRRYNTDYEAIRHYIDLDNYGSLPFDGLPRELSTAIAFNSEIYFISGKGDSTLLMKTSNFIEKDLEQIVNEKCKIKTEAFLIWTEGLIKSFGQREEYSVVFDLDDLPEWLEVTSNVTSGRVAVIDKFSEHGIAPYYLEKIYTDLIFAFKNYNGKKILQLSSDIGHYIADIHVPLHTTKNYNGADSDQLGIHAFWETRLPELYAEEYYDLMVGKAEYISDVQSFFWDSVLESHRLLGEVFSVEKELSITYPTDQQYCYEERNNKTVRLECEEYANAYHREMNGMVEKRMRESISGVGSIWFSAWVLAGQPDLSSLVDNINFGEDERKAEKELPLKSNKVKIRQHVN